MVAVLLVDAVSVPLLQRMIADGRAPNIAGLRAAGVWHVPSSVATYFGDRQTVHSGVGVAEHGQTFPLQWSAAEQRLRFYTSFDTVEAVWERIARAGRRCFVVDPYEGRAPKTPAGTVMSGWQFAHPAVLQRWSSPRSAYKAAARRFGRSPVVEDVYGQPSRRGLENLRRQLLVAPGRVAHLVENELAQNTHDLVWIEFCAGHLAGHHFWDLAHLGLADKRRIELEAVVEETYRAIDEAVGRVVAALPADSDIVVASETGMAANASRTDLLPEMLGRVLGSGAGDETLAGEVLWRVRAGIPARARMAATRALPDRVVHELSARLFLHGVDWRKTRAFVLPSDHDGYIRLNLQGRERNGVVDAAQEDSLVEEIVDGLASFVDPDGAKCVAGVERVTDLIGVGARSSRLPDLLVRWTQRQAVSLRGVTSPRFGDVRRRGLGAGRSGNHVDEPWILVVPGASRPRTPTRNPRLVDVAATVAHLLQADQAALAGEPLLTPA